MAQERLLKPSYEDYTGQLVPENLFLINELEQGRWYEIPVTEKHSSLAFNETSITVPLLPGKDIILAIGYEGSVEFQEKIRSMNNYPETNPLFNSLTLEKTRPEYKFVSPYKARNGGVPPEKIALGPGRYSKAVKDAHDFLSQKDRKNFEAVLKGLEGEKTLENIFLYLEKYLPLIEEKNWAAGKKLNPLADIYKNLKLLVGEQEGTAIFITAAFSALRIPARKITGITTALVGKEERETIMEKRRENLEKKISSYGLPWEIREHLEKQVKSLEAYKHKIKNGFPKEIAQLHTWNEVFIPVNKMIGYWALFDHAEGLAGTYPSKPEYAITAQLPLMKGANKAKIKLEYG